MNKRIQSKEDLFSIKIPLPDKGIEKQVKERWDKIAKPLDSLGRFEEMIVKIGGITGTAQVSLSPGAVLIFCADNGIVEEGISQSGQEVTAVVAESMAKGQSSVCRMAACTGASVKVIDIGVNKKLDREGIICKKVARGTKNFLKETAMTEEQTLKAIATGIEAVSECKREGCNILCMGEMGIGNTTTSSAVAAALLHCRAEDITGRGAGLSDAGLRKKTEVIKTALLKYELWDKDPFTVLMSVGGLDIAGLAGMCIGGAVCHIPVILDGVISLIAALLAEKMVPGVKSYLIPSHLSREPAAFLIMKELGVNPVIDAEMALGEGTGAVMMLSLLKMALSVYEARTGFDEIGINRYSRFKKEEFLL